MDDRGQQVFIIDDNASIRRSMGLLLDSLSLPHCSFASASAFLQFYDGSQQGCLVLDMRMPGMDGLELQETLNARGSALPIIFITGHGDIPMAVEAMRSGAFDFLLKPVNDQDLVDRIRLALEKESETRDSQREQTKLQALIDSLSPRQREIFERVADGQGNKFIAADLGISERTVEVHRAQVMQKLKVRTLADLIKVKVRADASTPGA